MRIKTSKYRGVSKHKTKWRVRYKRKQIGLFNSEKEAAIAYNKVADRPNQLGEYFICWRCKEKKHKSKFYENKRSISGVDFECKLCHNITIMVCEDLRNNGLKRSNESLKYLSTKRLLKLIDKKIITKDEGRRIYNKDASTDRAYSIRFRKKLGAATGNSVR
jgi:hypothetical protein